jgi:hypothetical protein
VALIATAFAADNDVGALRRTIARFLTRVLFLSAVAAGVASSSGGGICSTIGAGFSFGAVAETSDLGFDPGFSVLGVGVASVLFKSSRRVAGAASWARANGGLATATPMHTTNWRIPLWRRIEEIFGAGDRQKQSFFMLQLAREGDHCETPPS